MEEICIDYYKVNHADIDKNYVRLSLTILSFNLQTTDVMDTGRVYDICTPVYVFSLQRISCYSSLYSRRISTDVTVLSSAIYKILKYEVFQ